MQTQPAFLPIPRVFHRIWLGTKPIPDEHEHFWQRWAQLHPEWSFNTWRDEHLAQFEMQNRAQFDACSTLAGKSDIARLEILARLGGVYIDTDFEPLQNIEPLLWHAPAFLGWQDRDSANNAIFGAVPGHPFVQALRDAVPDGMRAFDRLDLQTGPGLVTRVLGAGEWPDVRQFGPSVFYPLHWSDVRDASGRELAHASWLSSTMEGAYAVHHWAMSWKNEVVVAPLPKTEPPKASIVIPFGGDLTRLAFVFAGLSAQEERGFEVIVVDDASPRPDSARAMCERFGARYVPLPADPDAPAYRPSQARNLGAQHARAPLLLFCDADCIPDPDWVAQHAQHAAPGRACYNLRRRLPEAEFARIEHEPLETLSWEWLRQHSTEKDGMDRRMGTRNEPIHEFWSHGISMLRTEFLALGGFDRRFDGVWGGEDTDLANRLLRSNFYLWKLAQCAWQTHLDHPKRAGRADGTSFLHDLAHDPTTPLVANGGPLPSLAHDAQSFVPPVESAPAESAPAEPEPAQTNPAEPEKVQTPEPKPCEDTHGGLDVFHRSRIPLAGELHATKPERAQRFCVATLCSEDEPTLALFDDWLGSVLARGDLGSDARIVVFCVGRGAGASGVEGIVAAHRFLWERVPGEGEATSKPITMPEIVVVPVQPLAPVGIQTKALLYSVHRWLPDQTILAMDCDTLVLRSLRPLLEAAQTVNNVLVPCPDQSAPPGHNRFFADLVGLLGSYVGVQEASIVAQRLDARHPLASQGAHLGYGNSGVLVAQRALWAKAEEALLSWQDAWRPLVEALPANHAIDEPLGLASLDAFHLRGDVDETWNFALWQHEQIARVRVEGQGEGFRAFDGEREIAVLHFAGGSKVSCAHWRGHFAGRHRAAQQLEERRWQRTFSSVPPNAPQATPQAIPTDSEREVLEREVLEEVPEGEIEAAVPTSTTLAGVRPRFRCRGCHLETDCTSCIAPGSIAAELHRNGQSSILCLLCQAQERGLPSASVPLDVRLDIQSRRSSGSAANGIVASEGVTTEGAGSTGSRS